VINVGNKRRNCIIAQIYQQSINFNEKEAGDVLVGRFVYDYSSHEAELDMLKMRSFYGANCKRN